jgi:hypothetical protein
MNDGNINKMDISWILEQERLDKIQKKCEREYFSNIELISIYINLEMEIETIEKETMDITNDIKVLSTDLLKEWSIQKQKYTPKSMFELKNTLWFHVDIEADQIQTIEEQSSVFLKEYLYLEEIKLTPSIFIFHSLTSLIFIYYEKNNPLEPLEPLDIMKKKEKNLNKKKCTLRIVVPSKHKNKMRITRKI